jgi:hypothetical protein
LLQLGDTLSDKHPTELVAIAKTEDLAADARFALLEMATKKWANIGDMVLAFHVIDGMADEYEVDPFQRKAEAVTVPAETIRHSQGLREIALACLHLVDEATRREDHQLAEQLAVAALRAARRAEDSKLAKLATQQVLTLRQRDRD